MKMCKKLLCWALIFAMLLPCTAYADVTDLSEEEVESAATIKELPDAAFAEERLLVKLERRPAFFGADSIFDGIAAEVTELFPVYEGGEGGDVMPVGMDGASADWLKVELAEGVDMLQAWNRLLAEDAVLAVQPDYIMYPTATEITANDPYMASQSWLEQIGAPAVWKEGYAGEGIVVAVVDTGVDMDHPDLAGQLLDGFDFVSYENGWDDNPDDEDGHGTHVAGIIAAAKNSIGVRGVAYEAEILPVRVLGVNGGYSSDIADAIRWAAGAADTGILPAKKKADVINMSFGGFGENPIQADAINYARRQGCLPVAAAGNETFPTNFAGDGYFGSEVSPAGIKGVLTVMAMKQFVSGNNDWLANFSNYDADIGSGQEYEIMAPGVNIFSTVMGGGYTKMDGTSMASPVVAGAAAVLMGMGCSADEAWELLVVSGDVRRGKTTPGGEVLDYPAVDLQSAVTMKNNGGSKQSVVTANEWVGAELRESFVEETGVDYAELDTFNYGYYCHNGENEEFVSTVMFGFENFGGAGPATITGTVGGCEIVEKNIYANPGESACVVLEFSGVPLTEDGKVKILLQVNGKQLSPLTLKAADMRSFGEVEGFDKKPFDDSEGYCYRAAEKGTVTLRGSENRSTVWVIDHAIHLYAGETLMIEPAQGDREVTVYQAENAYFSMSSDAALELTNVLCTGAALFDVFGYADLNGCRIYEPHLEEVNRVDQCVITCNYQWNGDAIWVEAERIVASGFYDMIGANIMSEEFSRNLINHCINCRLTVFEKAVNNSFVDNFGNGGGSVLKVYVPAPAENGQGEPLRGLWDSCVVGPADICLPPSEDGEEAPAEVKNLYCQSTDDPDGMFKMVIPGNEGVVTDFSKVSWAKLCPAFVLGKSVSYGQNPNFDALDITIEFSLSTAIDKSCTPGVRSRRDPLVEASCGIHVEGNLVTVRTIAPYRGGELKNDYMLYGVYTKEITEPEKLSFWATELYGQAVTVTAEIGFKWMDEMRVSYNGEEGRLEVIWRDARIQQGQQAVITRSVDGDAYEVIAEVDANAGSYVDSDTSAGHYYSYQVEIFEEEELICRDSSGFVWNVRSFHGGENLTSAVEDDTITLKLDYSHLIREDAPLCYTIPAAMAKSISFSRQTLESRLTLSAVDNSDGTVTVSIAAAEGDDVLLAGNLFTLTVQDGVAIRQLEDDVLCRTNASTMELWHLSNCDVMLAGYRSGQLCKIDKVFAEEWNTIHTLQKNDADCWKAFAVDGAMKPLGTAQTLS